jgi:diguanylate cyclase (GGDEF)-like protein
MNSDGLKILVVDDDPAVVRVIRKILACSGHQLLEASNGRQALEMILADCPDLLISDWEMPEMDGLELCRRIRQEDLPHYLYTILLTAKTCVTDMVEGLGAGADDFLTKPVVSTVVLARVQAGARVVRLEHELRRLSNHDPLTGVLNRRHFRELCRRELERSIRYRRPLACVMIDLDFFKRINDAHGHSSGDAALKAIASILRKSCRSSDVVCRYGGEEFCVLLPETAEEGAAIWADRLRVALAEMELSAGDRPLRVTASFGIAERIGTIDDADALMDMADQALLVAKESGRDRVVRFSSLSDSSLVELSHSERFAGPLDGIVARDIMAEALFCPHEDDTVRQVTDFFLQLRLDSAPVVDSEGRLVGMVSVTDLMMTTASGEGWQQRVGEVTKTSVVSYEENTPVKQIFDFLARISLSRVIVVEQGRPTGIISRDSLLRWFRNWIMVNHGQGSRFADTGPTMGELDRKASVLKTAEALARRAEALPGRLGDQPADFAPCVVGEATRLQELVDDLLAHCRKSQVI